MTQRSSLTVEVVIQELEQLVVLLGQVGEVDEKPSKVKHENSRYTERDDEMSMEYIICFFSHGYLVSYVKVLFQSFPIGRMCCCCTSQPLFWSQNTIVGTETDPKIANCNYFRSIRALCILPVSPQLILLQTN